MPRNDRGQFVKDSEAGGVAVAEPPVGQEQPGAEPGPTSHQESEQMTPELEARLKRMGWVSPSEAQQRPVPVAPVQTPYVGSGLIGGEDPNTEDFIPDQPPPIYMPGDLLERFYAPQDVIVAREEQASQSQLEEMKFQNEAVMIYIHPQPKEHPDSCVPCFVNGRGAEVWDNRVQRWLSIGFLPVEQNVITRRQYVEVLGRARIEMVNNQIVDLPGGHKDNVIRKRQGSRWPFSIRMDWNKSLRAQQWYRTMFAQRF